MFDRLDNGNLEVCVNAAHTVTITFPNKMENTIAQRRLRQIPLIEAKMRAFLKKRKHLFLNEVYDAFHFNRSSDGAVIGWLWHEEGDENKFKFNVHADKEGYLSIDMEVPAPSTIVHLIEGYDVTGFEP